MGVVGAGAAVAEAEADATAASGEPLARPAYRVIRRKRSVMFRIMVLLIVMLILMACIWLAIWKYLAPRMQTTGEMK